MMMLRNLPLIYVILSFVWLGLAAAALWDDISTTDPMPYVLASILLLILYQLARIELAIRERKKE